MDYSPPLEGPRILVTVGEEWLAVADQAPWGLLYTEHTEGVVGNQVMRVVYVVVTETKNCGQVSDYSADYTHFKAPRHESRTVCFKVGEVKIV